MEHGEELPEEIFSSYKNNGKQLQKDKDTRKKWKQLSNYFFIDGKEFVQKGPFVSGDNIFNRQVTNNFDICDAILQCRNAIRNVSSFYTYLCRQLDWINYILDQFLS